MLIFVRIVRPRSVMGISINTAVLRMRAVTMTTLISPLSHVCLFCMNVPVQKHRINETLFSTYHVFTVVIKIKLTLSK